MTDKTARDVLAQAYSRIDHDEEDAGTAADVMLAALTAAGITLCDTATHAVVPRISPIEIIALRKLALVSKALATKLGGTAGREQDCLAQVLVDVLDRCEVAAAERSPDREGISLPRPSTR